MIDRAQIKAELAMRIRFAAGGTIPVSGTLLENTLELLEEDEKKMADPWDKSYDETSSLAQKG